MRARAAVLILLTCGSCRGPQPVVTEQRLLAGEPLRVEALVENRSGGSGQIAVVADLTERSTGRLVARESTEIELEAHGSVGVVLELRVPSLLGAATRDRLELRVAARYPIE